MKIIINIILAIFLFGINYSFAAINLTVSPIKYELSGDIGETITKIATLHNYGDNDIQIITGKSDFIASGTDGSHSFVRYSELVHSDQQLSNWISLSSSGFTIPANSKKEISFNIDIPSNATPGGHYGAVF
ncbi:MAG: Fn3-like domain-containing protein, partial [Candidatus Gracilibacteria bacterium]|nr:Fn3-like domain-containing protein [Candidatus Gracilibacteria bacterium]